MILNIYTVLDTAVEAHLQPFFARSHGEAMRMFSQAVNDTNTNLNRSPGDYTLWYVGSFDDANAFVSGETAVRLMSGLEAKIKDVTPQ